MLILLLLLIAAIFIYGFTKKPANIQDRPWQHFYDNIHLSTAEFYQAIESGLRERKIEGLKFAQEAFQESHIFSAKRVYLRITQAEYVFYVCAAPFGTGTFVSWWLCIKDENFLNRIPILSKLMGKDRGNKTFYQMDTESMYRSAVHTTVIDVANTLTENKGVRLSELERRYLEPQAKGPQAN
jgi:hypothetical protein